MGRASLASAGSGSTQATPPLQRWGGADDSRQAGALHGVCTAALVAGGSTHAAIGPQRVRLAGPLR